MIGIIDFSGSGYPISIPVYNKRNSNGLFLPKTDPSFLILDFYELDPDAYPLRYETPILKSLQHTEIGCYAAVPIVSGPSVGFIDPRWTREDISRFAPELTDGVLKYFFSLRDRILSEDTDGLESRIRSEFDEILNNPVSSRYWISRFGALVSSASSNSNVSQEFLEEIRKVQLDWLIKFSTKAPLDRVEKVVDAPIIQMSEKDKQTVILKRFHSHLQSKGIRIPKKELERYSEIYPLGIETSLRERHGGNFDFWSNRNKIAEALSVAVADRFSRPFVDTTDPNLWSAKELRKWELLVNIVYGDSDRFDLAIGPFVEMLSRAVGKMADITASSDATRLFRQDFYVPSSMNLLKAIGMEDEPVPVARDRYPMVLRRVFELNQKLNSLVAITRPKSASGERSFAFDEIDYNILNEIISIYNEVK